jgi:uncharacterized membrane protein
LTIVTDVDQEVTVSTKFIVRRNQSLSWQGNKRFILYITLLSFGIAGVFAFQGLWLILPFAGIEILALAVGLYLCCLRNRQQEVVVINDNSIVIEKGALKPSEKWELDRAWIQLELQTSKYQGHPSKLLIRSKGKEIEIGECLTDEEKQSLASSLAKTLCTQIIKS